KVVKEIGLPWRDRETHQRRAAFGKTPTVIAERIDPPAFVEQGSVLAAFADQPERAGLSQRPLGTERRAQNQFGLQVCVLPIAGGKHDFSSSASLWRGSTPHTD